MNLGPAKANIGFSKGDDIIIRFVVNDCSSGEKVPVNISAWTITCSVEKMDGNAVSGIVITAETDFVRIIKIPRTQTDNDDRNEATYRVICIDENDNRKTYFKGMLIQID